MCRVGPNFRVRRADNGARRACRYLRRLDSAVAEYGSAEEMEQSCLRSPSLNERGANGRPPQSFLALPRLKLSKYTRTFTFWRFTYQSDGSNVAWGRCLPTIAYRRGSEMEMKCNEASLPAIMCRLLIMILINMCRRAF